MVSTALPSISRCGLDRLLADLEGLLRRHCLQHVVLIEEHLGELLGAVDAEDEHLAFQPRLLDRLHGADRAAFVGGIDDLDIRD